MYVPAELFNQSLQSHRPAHSRKQALQREWCTCINEDYSDPHMPIRLQNRLQRACQPQQNDSTGMVCWNKHTCSNLITVHSRMLALQSLPRLVETAGPHPLCCMMIPISDEASKVRSVHSLCMSMCLSGYVIHVRLDCRSGRSPFIIITMQ